MYCYLPSFATQTPCTLLLSFHATAQACIVENYIETMTLIENLSDV